MNLKILGILLSIIQILVGIWYFDWHSWNHIIVSVLLFLGGSVGFLTDAKSKFLMKVKRFIQIFGLMILILYLIKLFFVR
jgi:hypothetical protein